MERPSIQHHRIISKVSKEGNKCEKAIENGARERQEILHHLGAEEKKAGKYQEHGRPARYYISHRSCLG